MTSSVCFCAPPAPQRRDPAAEGRCWKLWLGSAPRQAPLTLLFRGPQCCQSTKASRPSYPDLLSFRWPSHICDPLSNDLADPIQETVDVQFLQRNLLVPAEQITLELLRQREAPRSLVLRAICVFGNKRRLIRGCSCVKGVLRS